MSESHWEHIYIEHSCASTFQSELQPGAAANRAYSELNLFENNFKHNQGRSQGGGAKGPWPLPGAQKGPRRVVKSTVKGIIKVA